MALAHHDFHVADSAHRQHRQLANLPAVHRDALDALFHGVGVGYMDVVFRAAPLPADGEFLPVGGSLAQRVRNQLDALGATNTKITVTNDLDEYALASLQTAPVDSYGVGTMLVTGSGAPTCAMVYKLTERENSAGDMQPVAKKSKDKATVPGRKLAFRSYEYSLADCEHVISGSEEQLAAYQPEEGWKDLLVGYVSNGEINSDYQGHEAIVNAHNYRAQALAELPIGAQSLMKGDPVIPTEVTVL